MRNSQFGDILFVENITHFEFCKVFNLLAQIVIGADLIENVNSHILKHLYKKYIDSGLLKVNLYSFT